MNILLLVRNFVPAHEVHARIYASVDSLSHTPNNSKSSVGTGKSQTLPAMRLTLRTRSSEPLGLVVSVTECCRYDAQPIHMSPALTLSVGYVASSAL